MAGLFDGIARIDSTTNVDKLYYYNGAWLEVMCAPDLISTISELTISSKAILNNTKPLRVKDSVGTERDVLLANASDDVLLGNSNMEMVINATGIGAAEHTPASGDKFIALNNADSERVVWVDLDTVNSAGSGMTSFQLEDGDGTEVTIDDAKEVKFIDGDGMSIDWTDTSTGSDADPFDMTFAVDSTVVRTTGNQDIGGVKTHSNNMVLWNDVYLNGTGTDASTISLVGVDGNNDVKIGSTSQNQILNSSGLASETTLATGDQILFRDSSDSKRTKYAAQSKFVLAGTTQTITGTKTFSANQAGLKYTANQSGLVPGVISNCTSGSYNSAAIQTIVNRTDSSAYFHIVCDNNTGRNMKVRGDGNGYIDTAWNDTAADFAEYMEWEDGNPLDEDRRGVTVTPVGDGSKRIRPAKIGDPVVGAVSATPGFVCGNDWDSWHGKFKRDEYDQPIKEVAEFVTWTEGEGDSQETRTFLVGEVPNGVTIPKHAEVYSDTTKVISDSFDPALEYIPTEDRREKVIIGITGFLLIRDGQPTDPRWQNFGSVGNGLSRWLIR